MPTPSRVLPHLLLVTGCLLLSSVIIASNKLWFVDATGRIGNSFWLDLLLCWLIFRQWRPARMILLVLTGLHTALLSAILCYNLQHGSHLLGYCIVLPPLLVALGMLAFSAPIKQFLDGRSTVAIANQR